MEKVSNNMQLYCLLKDEILYYIKAQDTIVTVTITATIALLTLAFQSNVLWLTLVASVFIALMYATTVSFQNSILKIAGYMQVFLEPILSISWEHDVKEFQKYLNDNKIELDDTIFNKLKKNIFVALELLCLIVCIVSQSDLLMVFVSQVSEINPLIPLLNSLDILSQLNTTAVSAVVQVFIILLIGYLLYSRQKRKGTYSDKKRASYETHWRNYKAEKEAKLEQANKPVIEAKSEKS